MRFSIYLFFICLLFWGSVLYAEETFPVKTMQLEKKTVQSIISAFGVLEEEPQILYFETAGYLSKLLADEGQAIEKGRLLAKLDTTLIDNKKARVQQILKHDKNKLARAKKLKLSKVLTQEQLEDREDDYALQLLELKRVEEERRKYFLHAPTTGKILKRLIDFAGTLVVSTTSSRF